MTPGLHQMCTPVGKEHHLPGFLSKAQELSPVGLSWAVCPPPNRPWADGKECVNWPVSRGPVLDLGVGFTASPSIDLE